MANTLIFRHLTLERIAYGSIFFILDTSRYIIKHKLLKLNVKNCCKHYSKEHKIVTNGMKGYFTATICPVVIMGFVIYRMSNCLKDKM